MFRSGPEEVIVSTIMELRAIGRIRRDDGGVHLQVDEPYRPGLHQLGLFSHAIVLWWADKEDSPDRRSIMRTELPYAPGVEAGVFACRAEYRPNPIATTVCKLEEVDEERGVVRLTEIDAYDGTPLLDIKPYIGVVDRVAEVVVPDWFEGWPEWLPDEGIGLYE
jgi:tRNA-Thr(GGU) m(6)t(6)A37 methyltransferase TsaA